MHKWFVYDPDNGFDTFETEEKAKDYLKERLDVWIDESDCDEWCSEIEELCMGTIDNIVVLQKEIEEREPDEMNIEYYKSVVVEVE